MESRKKERYDVNAKYMKRAIELSKLGAGYTNPNPLVGAVIVKENKVIAEGYHMFYGGHHAEINALKNTTEDVRGATMYVALEPCSHQGKTPPCVNTIVEKGISKVVIGMEDPNPLVAGKGVGFLRDNNVEVITGIFEEEIQKLNESYVKYITTQKPFCILKTAMTLDGKIATKIGDSRWISNTKSREYVHWLRHRYASIMVGIGTILADDPLLTTRLNTISKKGAVNPIRVIVDTHGKIPLEANVLNIDSDANIIIATTEKMSKEKYNRLQQKGAEIILTPLKDDRVDLRYLMEQLGQRSIDSVLLEGGSTLNYSALNEGIVDKVISFVAPKMIGGCDAKTAVGGAGRKYMDDAIQLHSVEILKFSEDIMIQGYVKSSWTGRNIC